MARDRENPLAEQDRRNIGASLVNLNKMLADVEVMEAVGEDTSEFRARHAKLMQDLDTFQKTYFQL